MTTNPSGVSEGVGFDTCRQRVVYKQFLNIPRFSVTEERDTNVHVKGTASTLVETAVHMLV